MCKSFSTDVGGARLKILNYPKCTLSGQRALGSDATSLMHARLASLLAGIWVQRKCQIKVHKSRCGLGHKCSQVTKK